MFERRQHPIVGFVDGPGPRSILWTGFNGGDEGFGVAFETAREWRMKKGGL